MKFFIEMLKGAVLALALMMSVFAFLDARKAHKLAIETNNGINSLVKIINSGEFTKLIKSQIEALNK